MYHLNVYKTRIEYYHCCYLFIISTNCFHSDHAEKATIIMEKLLPEGHLMLASVKRVKALILEEIALDTMPNNSGIISVLILGCLILLPLVDNVKSANKRYLLKGK